MTLDSASLAARATSEPDGPLIDIRGSKDCARSSEFGWGKSREDSRPSRGSRLRHVGGRFFVGRTAAEIGLVREINPKFVKWTR